MVAGLFAMGINMLVFFGIVIGTEIEKIPCQYKLKKDIERDRDAGLTKELLN